MKLIKSVFTLFLLGLFIISCGDEDPMNVNLKLQMNVGDEALVHGTTYNINGTDVQFTNVAFYLGDMKCELSNGTSYQAPSQYYLIKPGVYDFNFPIPDDEVNDDMRLSDITFFVGVDAETNAETELDFTERADGDPLGEQNPTMHWGWAGGYRFLNIDGNADLDGDGEFETTLTFHLGRNEMLKNISLSPSEKLEEGSNDFQLVFDLSTFLGNLDFANENFTKVTPNDKELAEKIFNNYSSSFTIAK